MRGRDLSRRSTPFSIRSSSPLIPEFTRHDTTSRPSSRVKRENFSPVVKSEPGEDIIDLTSPVQVRTQTLDDDIIEILSSDDEFQVGVLSDDVDMDFEDKTLLEECAATSWQDPSIVSRVVYNGEPIMVTRQLKVERIEVLEGLPSVWPVPRIATAYLVDLRAPEFDVEENGKTFTVDGLIKNKVS